MSLYNDSLEPLRPVMNAEKLVGELTTYSKPVTWPQHPIKTSTVPQ